MLGRCGDCSPTLLLSFLGLLPRAGTKRRRESGENDRKRERKNEGKNERGFIDITDPAKLGVLFVGGHKMSSFLSVVSRHSLYLHFWASRLV